MKKFCGKVKLWFEKNKKELIISALGGVLIGAAYSVGGRERIKRDNAEVIKLINAGVIKYFDPSNGAELKTWDELVKVTNEVLGRK